MLFISGVLKKVTQRGTDVYRFQYLIMTMCSLQAIRCVMKVVYMLITTTGEAYSTTAGQEVLRSSWNSYAHYRVYNSQAVILSSSP